MAGGGDTVHGEVGVGASALLLGLGPLSALSLVRVGAAPAAVGRHHARSGSGARA